MTRRTRGVGLIGAMVLASGLVAVAAGAGGDLDPSFGSGGIVTTATAPGDGGDFQNGLAVRDDRSIVVAGSSDMAAAGDQFRVSQYTKRGELDTSFGSGGTVLTSVSPQGFEHIWEIALEPGGKIVVAGEADMGTGSGRANFALARYSADGALDRSFGNGGVIVTPTAPDGGYDAFYEVVLDKTGKIVASGECDQPTTGTDVCVARYQTAPDE